MEERDQQLLSLLGDQPDKFPRQLAARFPHIVERLVSLWGKPEIDRYFGELMVADDRRRQGFPPEIAMEIFSLSMLHDKLFPRNAPRKDAWSQAVEQENGVRKAVPTTTGKPKP
jgi:hypothetical protein